MGSHNGDKRLILSREVTGVALLEPTGIEGTRGEGPVLTVSILACFSGVIGVQREPRGADADYIISVMACAITASR